MPTRISNLIELTTETLEGSGVFDGFVDLDSKLHVDPSLFENCQIPEFSNGRQQIEKYFNEVLTLIIAIQSPKDRFWKLAHKRLQFKELANAALGYSNKGTSGSAIGPVIAERILDSAQQIVAAGINDPLIFEIVGIFEEDMGPDRISDMTISIMFGSFLAYTQRICGELNAQNLIRFKYKSETYDVPIASNGSPVIFIPKELLNSLPIALEWSDLDMVCAYNEALRERMNAIIGLNWKEVTKGRKKRDIKKVLLENPELIDDLLEQYRKKNKTGYDFIKDPLGEIIWSEVSGEAPVKHPLDLSQYLPLTPENLLEIVRTICNHFGELLEFNGWFEYLYTETGKRKPERAVQLLFFGIAESYCIANNLDINRETNAGKGALDFKASRGFISKINVEVKYSTNPNLIKGYENQLPAYNRAERTDTSIYLVVKMTDDEKRIDNLLQTANNFANENSRVPEIIVIDGRTKPSHSNL